MTFLIETADGEIFEVTTLFDKYGEETLALDAAIACVIKFSETEFASTMINGRLIHRAQ